MADHFDVFMLTLGPLGANCFILACDGKALVIDPGDEILGYISLGKGVTIHRAECKNARILFAKNRERFTTVTWEGLGAQAFRVEVQVEALDRNHLLEDIARTLSDSGSNIVGGAVQTLSDGVVRDRFVLEIGDVHQLANIIANLKAIGTVYDAYRVVSS